MLRRLLTTTLVLLATLVFAGTPGTFRGTVVEPHVEPHGAEPGWVYLQARNGALRKVDVSRARFAWDDSIPKALREKTPAKALVPGVEVRITAEQDGSGEWRASEIEILKTGNKAVPARNSPGKD
jgi:hypothetical protein